MPYVIVSTTVSNYGAKLAGEANKEPSIYIQTLEKSVAVELVANATDEPTTYKLKGICSLIS